ncbi:Leu/Ile/Val-binding protein [Beijerinckiaceae bacterium RH AL1]|nr:branched-chain amino acid ABC transporter substrate-binding protein [Beijerinckiaceae bacterium]VVB43294.1 Leu/Ile/Val-binding protein [Beijerinckiaceae bacterium RH AL8]VVB43309.1 Leu/Ile/Val-binding protein [Beijerinckiaceae bacterium RH CH11]VVC53768.1 Leu/Ile/Val-binding protein [Beijerinckiaceae bacterium RH AL1]
MRAARLAAVTFLLAVPLAPAAAFTIGVSAPTSGADAVFGDQLRLGVGQAIADIDADGGFLGEKATMKVADDGADPKKGIDVAKAFVADKVPVVVGPFSSAVAAPASAVYAEAGTLDLLPAATAPSITERGLQTVFRLCAREDAQAPAAARYMQRHFARVAFLHDRTGPSKSLTDAVRAALKGGPAHEVFYGSLEKGTRDVAGLAVRLKASGAQAVFWGGGPTEAGLLARQLRDSGARIAFIGGFALASDEFANVAGPAADGTLVVFPRDPRARPAAAALLRRLQARNPDGVVFSAYAAVQVIAQAAARANSLEPRALADALHAGQPFKTVLGDLAFDAKGDLLAPDLAVYLWHRGAAGRMAIDDEAG